MAGVLVEDVALGLGGAGPWSIILTAGGVGAIVGSVVAIRIRPARPLVACVFAAVPISLQSIFLAVLAPTWAIAAAAFLGGVGISVHLTLWFTVFQREVPERAQSRVSAYDVLGSFVLMPIGLAIAGPLSDAIGVSETLWAGVALMWATWLAILLLPSIWAIRQTPRPNPA